MRVIVLTSRGREVAARVAAESIERWHPGAEIELVDLGPRAEVGMVGELRHSDVHVGLGPAWARWAALPSVLTSRLDDELVVLPDSVWLIGSDLPEAEGTTFLARHGDARTGITYGGLVPELLQVGPSSGEVLGWWTAQAVASTCGDGLDAGVDPWSEFVSGGEGVTISSSGAFRLGPWLAPDADVVRLGDQVALDGSPVSIVHFPGFDPTEPFWWPNGDRRGTLLSGAPAMRPIVHAYAEAL
ncbi:MAG TPA: hypothetical protein VJM33_11775, partial [Microthrixaceae bacterium]|nr:hypothetical protein [Microthrixaceae bacterium]